MALVAPILSPEKSSRPALLTSPSRSPSRTSRRTSRTPTTHRLSVTQSEPSPSPRKAILKNPGAVSFTPKGVKKAPRAWERRPATPFVPRNEGQKIWKRVPLADLGVEVNRKVERGSEDYVRVVKKLKMDDEVVQAMTCIDDEEGLVVRKVPITGATAEDDDDVDEIGNSDEVLPVWEPGQAIREVANNSKSEPSEVQENTDRTDTEAAPSLTGSEVNHAVEQNDVAAQPDISSQPTVGTPVKSTDDADQMDEQDIETMKSPSQLDAPPELETLEPHIAGEDVLTGPASTGDGNEAERDCDEAQPDEADEAADEIADENTTHQTLDTTGLADAEDFSPIRPYISDQPIDQQQVRDSVDKTLEYLSPPESVNVEEIVTVDESNLPAIPAELSQANTPIKEVGHAVEASEETQAADVVESSQDNARPRPSLDDAAFLHAFLSRTKAQREARNLEKQEFDSQEAAPAATEDDCAEPAESVEPETIESEVVVPNQETGADLKEQDEANTEDAQTSPIRRSKRTATVQSSAASVPRIQLKRAVGSEFIFTANKSQTPANVAMMTRTNTKRNRGQAVAVSARLDQLRSRIDGEENGLDADEIGNAGKKRKRDKADKAELAAKKKVLRWNDDRLTSYSEANANAEEDIEVNEREGTPEMENNVRQDEDEQDEEMSALAKKISSPSKVRRVRRNIPATPIAETPAGAASAKPTATKARSKRGASALIESQPVKEPDVPAVETDKDSKPSAIPGPRRSRMPVRVGRQGKAAGEETTKTAKTQVNGEAKSADDGMTKRRLRVRS